MTKFREVDLWGRPRTPYAIFCHSGHGLVYLTTEEYDRQMMAADDLWICPICGHRAEWQDDNYEESLDQALRKQKQEA